jgi:hypothetical protein
MCRYLADIEKTPLKKEAVHVARDQSAKLQPNVNSGNWPQQTLDRISVLLGRTPQGARMRLIESILEVRIPQELGLRGLDEC